MEKLELNLEEREHLARLVQQHLDAELDVELGRFEAEALVELLIKDLGAVFYNKGLLDAQAVFSKSLDQVQEEIYALEMPVSKRS